MSVPESLLNAIGASAPTIKNPLEKLGEPPFSGSEGPSFSVVMNEAAGRNEISDKSADDAQELDPGKALPELPERSVRNRLRLVPATDQNLEEFAVGMGIDRSLARLLLSETAPTDATVIENYVTEDAPAAPIANPVITPTMTPAQMTTDLAVAAGDESTPAVSIDRILVESRFAQSRLEEGASTERASIENASTDCIVVDPVRTVTTSSSPIGDEDLLLWRSMFSAVPAPAEVAPQTAAIKIAEPTPSISTADQLRTRSGAVITAAVAAGAANSSVSSIKPRDVAIPFDVEGLSVRTAATTKPSNSTSPDALPTLREFVSMTNLEPSMSKNGHESFGEQPRHPASQFAAITELPVAMNIAPLSENADSSLLMGISSSAGVGSAASSIGPIVGAEATRSLATPDPKLSFGERVQAFADAVAQRVLGQVRDENWSVSLQLEPANLGAMDIDLAMRGNTVAATVGVANAEVRTLLEAGLPRLRDSLESAGLQLAGWTFGQSGSRGFSEPARKMFSPASFRDRVNDVASVAESSAGRLITAKDAGSGAVDLFV